MASYPKTGLWLVALFFSLLLVGCTTTQPATTAAPVSEETGDRVYEDSLTSRPQYSSTYERIASGPVVIQNATVMTATGEEIAGGAVVLQDGKIVAVGTDVAIPDGATVVDGSSKYVTPGIIDSHSHLGVYAAPGTEAESDGNEAVAANTAYVWAEHSVWPQDPQIPLAVAGGITTIQVLPGSANLFGGRSATLRLVPAISVQEMKFPGAPYGLKVACGENPKRVYGNKGGPSTRMGSMAGYRKAFIEAEKYRRDWKQWMEGESKTKPDRDLGKETLMGVLDGDILVHNHCYRADEMMNMLDLGREFGFQIRSFHHAVEAYKIADQLAEAGAASSVWADWWGFKEEAMDGIPENAALLEAAGAHVIIHSDSGEGIQRLNQEAAKAMYAGRHAGLDISRNDALRWITAEPAWALGIDDVTGTLEVGKAADVVVWDGDPFSVYTRAEKVYNEGALVFDRASGASAWQTDFDLQQVQR